jgi:hypothetical protein
VNESAYYLGRPLPKYFEEGSEEHARANFFLKIKNAVYIPEDYAFSHTCHQEIEKLRHEFQTLKATLDEEARSVIISDEGFTNALGVLGVDRTRKAQRLRSIVGEAKILFVIRRQDKFLESLYGAYLRQANRLHPYCNFEEYLRLGLNRFPCTIIDYQSRCADTEPKNLAEEKIIRSASFGSPLGIPMFYEVIGEYAKVFGKENIIIKTFEDFTESPQAFVQSIGKEVGINLIFDEAASHTRATNFPNRFEYFHYRARISRLGDYFFRFLLKTGVAQQIQKLPYFSTRVKVAWSPELKEEIMNLYRQSNSLLEKEYDLDLAKKGYPLAS